MTPICAGRSLCLECLLSCKKWANSQFCPLMAQQMLWIPCQGSNSARAATGAITKSLQPLNAQSANTDFPHLSPFKGFIMKFPKRHWCAVWEMGRENAGRDWLFQFLAGWFWTNYLPFLGLYSQDLDEKFYKISSSSENCLIRYCKYPFTFNALPLKKSENKNDSNQ